MFTKFGALAALGASLFLVVATPAAAQISLGTAQSFGVLGGSAITNTGATTVNGNVGVSPGTAVTGFPPGIIAGGSLYVADGVALKAQNDLTTAYNAVAGTPCTANLTGQDLGTLLLPLGPGVYCFDTSAQLTGTLTLDGGGNPNAQFLFKIGSTLTTASGSSVNVINAGTGCNNVFWQVGSSATIGTGSSFAGNILALTSITVTTGSNTTGRLLARNGAVTLDTNNVNTCGVAACSAIAISPSALAPVTVGTPYNQTITATGGTGSYTFYVASGALPTGLTLNPTTGVISGVPSLPGNFNFSIGAVDGLGCTATVRPFTVNAINGPAAGVPALDPLALVILAALLGVVGVLAASRFTM